MASLKQPLPSSSQVFCRRTLSSQIFQLVGSWEGTVPVTCTAVTGAALGTTAVPIPSPEPGALALIIVQFGNFGEKFDMATVRLHRLKQ